VAHIAEEPPRDRLGEPSPCVAGASRLSLPAIVVGSVCQTLRIR
jgi:hypothetical protein